MILPRSLFCARASRIRCAASLCSSESINHEVRDLRRSRVLVESCKSGLFFLELGLTLHWFYYSTRAMISQYTLEKTLDVTGDFEAFICRDDDDGF